MFRGQRCLIIEFVTGSWKLFLLVGALLALLGLLSWLQYAAAEQVAAATRERLNSRLQMDAKRFAQDFNREIRNAYFLFQTDPGDWLKRDWTSFNARHQAWRMQTAYPQLVKNFYYVAENQAPLVYDQGARQFRPTEATPRLEQIRRKIQSEQKRQSFSPLVVDRFVLLMPNHAAGKEIGKREDGAPIIETEISGYLAIELDENTVRQMLADLAARYFANSESGDYKIIIRDRSDARIFFQNTENAVFSLEASDANVGLFDLSTDGYRAVVNARVFSADEPKSPDDRAHPINSPPAPKMNRGDTVKLQMINNRQSRENERTAEGLWLLAAQHRAGSLDRYVNQTKYKNLAASFGILLLLGASAGLLFVSAQRARDFARRQSAFVASVSHELRTPLAAIRATSENIRDGIVTDGDKVKEYGSFIGDEERRLTAMVEQMLEFAGAQTGASRFYDLQRASVEEIIEAALDDYRTELNKNDFDVLVQIEPDTPEIRADRDALRRAFGNLVGNAVKYGGAQAVGEISFVEISARTVKNPASKQVEISVRDNGAGITKKDLPHVFELFYRGRQAIDAQIKGSGIGLSLVKQIVEAHGGTINAANAPRRGSAFTIRLPAADETVSG